MSAKLKQPFVVENIPGALGQVGAQQCALSQPDGYTICSLFYGALVSAPLDRQAVGDTPLYDSEKAFAAVARTTNHGFVLIARKEVGSSLDEVRAYARTHGRLAVGYASPNARIATRLLASIVPGVDQVPATRAGGEGELVGNVISGVLQAAFINITTARAQTGNDAIRIVGVLGINRSTFLPSVRSLYEQGGTAFGPLVGWGGYFVPAGTPKDRIQVLSRVLLEAVRDEKVQSMLKNAWIEPYPAPSDILADQLKQDLDMYKKNLPAK
jgi:tripartite-type tricarboxylate transporter receptor subunit TctC